jgi:aromatic-L-amino-acid decarboxylase
VTFREDLDLAADWVDAYLARVAQLPVAADVTPGAIRALLPDAPPEHGEPVEALLRDLDEVILPGITHWNHPRFSRGSRIRAPSRGSSGSS